MHLMIYYYKAVLRIECIYRKSLYIIHIPVWICVRLCFPRTGQLIFIMDARGFPCEVAGKSRNVKCLVERVVLGSVLFFHTTFVLTCHYCSTSAPNLFAFSCYSYQKDKRAISGNPQKDSSVRLDVGEYWIITFKMFLIFKCWETLSVLHGSQKVYCSANTFWIRGSNLIIVTVPRGTR